MIQPQVDENKYSGEAGEEGSRCSSIRAEKVDKGDGGVDTECGEPRIQWIGAFA